MGNYNLVVGNDWNTGEVPLTIENRDRCDGPVTVGLSPTHARKLAVQLIQCAQGAEDNLKGKR